MKQRIIIRKVTGSQPGPTIAVMGGVHGDEPVGVKAIEAIGATLRLLRGTVIFIIANPPALAAGRRSIDRNLNRSLVDPPDLSTSEGKLAAQLMPVLDGCDALLDLHAGMGTVPPFVICEPNALPIAARLPVDIVSTGWTTVEPGSTDAYLYNQGKPALCLECGNRDRWRTNLPLAVAAIKTFLAYYNLIEYPLPPKRRQQVVAVEYAVFKPSADFRFERPFASFERLQPGEVIANDGSTTYRAPDYPSCIIFPWAEAPVGAEAFVIGRT